MEVTAVIMAVLIHAEALNEGNAAKAAEQLANNVQVHRLTLDAIEDRVGTLADIEDIIKAEKFEESVARLHPDFSRSSLNNDTLLFGSSSEVYEMLRENFKDGQVPETQMDVVWYKQVGDLVFAFERKKNKPQQKISDLISVYEVKDGKITAIWITVVRRLEGAACSKLLG